MNKFRMLALGIIPVLFIGACSPTETTSPTEESSQTETVDEETSETKDDRTAAALEGYELPQEATITPSVGDIQVAYPENWVFFNDYFIVSDESVNIFLGVEPGQTYTQFSANPAGAFGSEDIITYTESYSGQAENEEITYSDPTFVPITGSGIDEVVQQTATKEGVYDVSIYTLMATSGEFITFQFYTAPGEMGDQLTIAEAMLASVSFTPAP